MSEMDQSTILLQRQFFQLVAPEELILPPRVILKRPEIQARIYQSMFEAETMTFPSPPDRYKSRVLKILVRELEQSIDDPDEDEISDDLTACLAEALTKPAISDAEYAQRKSYVTYSAPLPLSLPGLAITTLESPALLAASGTTGLRTWEAAKLLATFLCKPEGRVHVHGKQIIELGAGTGLVSMFCARHLEAEFTLATDGTGDVVDSIVENMYLNQLDDKKRMDTAVLKWGHPVTPDVLMDEAKVKDYNLVLGADIIFDDRLILPLVSTLGDLFDQYKAMRGLIAATIRNVATTDKFLKACAAHDLVTAVVASSMDDAGTPQTGLFHSTEPEIKIFELTRKQSG